MANDPNDDPLPEFNDETRGHADEDPDELEDLDDEDMEEEEDEGSF